MSSPPTWKFWHPLAFWKVLAIMFLAQLVATFVVVALREGAGLPVPTWVAGGLGGVVGIVVIQQLAVRGRT